MISQFRETSSENDKMHNFGAAGIKGLDRDSNESRNHLLRYFAYIEIFRGRSQSSKFYLFLRKNHFAQSMTVSSCPIFLSSSRKSHSGIAGKKMSRPKSAILTELKKLRSHNFSSPVSYN